MEIQYASGLLGSVREVYAQGRLENTGERQHVGTTHAAQGDSISVSKDAMLLSEAHRVAQNAPDVRADKVEALRMQVANGTYKADSRLIAANLLREEPALFTL
ncbi:MAG TPA: flagellar biosynthesis anti-sigma factor FlgM [Candidatus Desulfovibrio gallistercoris]|nr:flagellar biosynthesis anti-sigma factor FlgM [Candidatus Desulfovibrio gallistercoris]